MEKEYQKVVETMNELQIEKQKHKANRSSKLEQEELEIDLEIKLFKLDIRKKIISESLIAVGQEKFCINQLSKKYEIVEEEKKGK